MTTGQIRTPWPGIFSALADVLYELAGYVMTKSTVAYTAGAGSITVESTDRFPAAGRIAVGGIIANYGSKTNTTLDSLTDVAGNPGIPANVKARSIITDISRLNTQIDDLRASFIVTTAADEELDIIARNYGITRPRGLADADFQDLLQAMIYIQAQLIYACEQILDILFGAGNYTLFEDLISFPHTVFVGIPAGGDNDPRGKAILVGGEVQTRTSTTTVDVDNPIRAVYGVYDATDPDRQGTNFAELSITGTTAVGSPTSIFSVALFLASDVSKYVTIDFGGTTIEEHWTVSSFVSSSELDLIGKTRDDGVTTGGAPTEFVTGTSWWAPWMVGHRLQILTGPNAGTFVIEEILAQKTIKLTGAAFVSDTDIEWRLLPSFPTDASVTFKINRSTFSGVTITTPVTMPVSVLVDYIHTPSAQALLAPSTIGNDQFPFYLTDQGAIAKQLLDLLTAAGVRVVIVLE